jgi:hypothetical protein
MSANPSTDFETRLDDSPLAISQLSTNNYAATPTYLRAILGIVDAACVRARVRARRDGASAV